MNTWNIYAAVAALVSAGMFAGSIYNQLVKRWTRCENAFAQIEVQLKRRYDLIPNLVETVRGYMAHERETLERVIAARDRAAAGLQQAANRPGDSEALKQWMGVEGALAGALGRLTVAMESYPELKANASVAALTEELTSTENRIAYARQAYNDWATGFNTYRQELPTCLLAGVLGFGQNRSYVEFPDQAKIAEAPRVVLA